MSDAALDAPEMPKPRSRFPLVAGLVLALAGAAGGFYAVWSGMILAPGGTQGATVPDADVAEVTFVPVDPLVVSMGQGAGARHLMFRAQLEVAQGRGDAVTGLMPRIVDVLNSYLRALDPSDLEAPAALTRLRAQMLRRVQVVVGDDKVTDLLVMEFVVN